MCFFLSKSIFLAKGSPIPCHTYLENFASAVNLGYLEPILVHPRSSAQRVPEPDPLPGISFDTRPDPIQF